MKSEITNSVFHIESQFCKSIGFDNSNLYLSSLQFGTIEALSDQCLNGNKRSSPFVPLHLIEKIEFDEQDNTLNIHFQKSSGGKKSYHLEGFSPIYKLAFAHALAAEAKLTVHRKKKNKKKDFQKSYVSIGGTVLFTGALIWISETPRTGRRSNLVKLVQDLGPIGVSIIGILIIMVILIGMYRRTKQPTDQHIYQR